MARQPTQKDFDEASFEALKGTTLRAYRFMLRSRNPVGIHDIQRGLALSSPSVAQYHVKKLIELRLIREEGEGYVVDKVVVDNVIRIRRTAIPVQAAFVSFFASSLGVMLTLLRPAVLTSTYLFALAVITVGLMFCLYETRVTMGHM